MEKDKLKVVFDETSKEWGIILNGSKVNNLLKARMENKEGEVSLVTLTF